MSDCEIILLLGLGKCWSFADDWKWRGRNAIRCGLYCLGNWVFTIDHEFTPRVTVSMSWHEHPQSYALALFMFPLSSLKQNAQSENFCLKRTMLLSLSMKLSQENNCQQLRLSKALALLSYRACDNAVMPKSYEHCFMHTSHLKHEAFTQFMPTSHWIPPNGARHFSMWKPNFSPSLSFFSSLLYSHNMNQLTPFHGTLAEDKTTKRTVALS